MPVQEKLIAWLKDVHAVKRHVETSLRALAKVASRQPALARRLHAHAERTATDVRLIEDCLRGFDARPSGLGSAVTRVLGVARGAAAALLGDPLMTHLAAAIALEQLEAATLAAISAAATLAKAPRCATVCRAMATRDANFGGRLARSLPATTRRYFARAVR